MPFRVVMLTNGSSHGIRILQGLQQSHVNIASVVHETRPKLRDNIIRNDGPGGRRIAVRRTFRRWFGSHLRRHLATRTYTHYTGDLILTGPLNSEQMRSDLQALVPDFIILGGIGILSPALIRVARYGVLNTHPGLLPWIRGVGVAGRAVERGVAVGGTCHYVNANIDQGDIVDRRLLHIKGTDTSLEAIEDSLHQLVADMMVDIVVEQLMQEKVPVPIKQTRKYPICKAQSKDERRAVNEQIRQGRSRELFEMWRVSCTGGSRFQLPSNFEAPGVR